MADVSGSSDVPAAVDGGETKTWHTVLGLGIFFGLLAVAIWFVLSLAPDHVTEKTNPGYIDNIFDSPAAIAAARVVIIAGAAVLLFGGLYIVVSLVVRMTQREWLRRFGPLEAQILETRLEEAETYLNEWVEASQQNEMLAAQLAQRDEFIQQLMNDREALQTELKRRGGT